MAQTVVGFFDDASEAREAVDRLLQKGFTRDNVDMTQNSGTQNTSYVEDRSRDNDSESGITRFFKSLFGGDDDEADRYSRVAQNSTSIVTVHAQSKEEAERAADVLDECGAINVDERAAQYSNTSGRRTDESMSREAMGNREAGNRRETSIPRVEENLEVGKRTEERGGVRVRSRIVERPVEEHVRLREEHVNVERTPVNRPISGDEASRLQDRDIELTERAEVPVVNKQARVVEEVKVTKDVEERDEAIRDTVRNTEVDVQKTDGRNKKNTDRPRR